MEALSLGLPKLSENLGHFSLFYVSIFKIVDENVNVKNKYIYKLIKTYNLSKL